MNIQAPLPAFRPFLAANGPVSGGVSADIRTPMDLVEIRYRPLPNATNSAVGNVLLTNPFGDWVFVTEAEMGSLIRGQLDEGTPLYAKLAAKNFIRSKISVDVEAKRLARKKRFLAYGPNLHICVVTLRCNETCVYCHASRADMDQVQTDMSPEIGEKVVDFMLQSTSPGVTLEFQGGEPLANFPVMKHIIEYAVQKNRAYGKQLDFTLVSNLGLMTDEKLDYLVDHKVQICTSIDGPEALHTKQRVLVGGNSHREAARWIEKINKKYIDLGLDPTLYHVEALLTTTREALKYPREIVDTYRNLGCRAIFLRPVDPFGFAKKTAGRIEYDRREYHDFYRTAVDHILSLNAKGEEILERYAAIFLTKIMMDEDSNFLDIRSPSGSAIGALAYNYDGSIFSSDEGRMIHEMGDDFFKIGDVQTSKYRDVMKHDTVRALVLASIRETQPDCNVCTYATYCGIQPEHSYRSQGSIFGQMRQSTLCSVHKGIQDFLFEKLQSGDEGTLETLKRWTTTRERSHFLQSSAAS